MIFVKYLYLCLAFIFLIIGCTGVVLPILPTTPFLLLSSICFAKGSDKFYNWFINTNLYKNNLKDFVDHKEMKAKTKIYLMALSSAMIIISIFIVDIIYLKLMLFFIDIFKYYYFVFKVKTI